MITDISASVCFYQPGRFRVDLTVEHDGGEPRVYRGIMAAWEAANAMDDEDRNEARHYLWCALRDGASVVKRPFVAA